METAHALGVAKVADVTPTGTDGLWWVKARMLVGVAVVGDVVVRVKPKVDIRRLVALLAHIRDGEGWRTDEVGLEESDGLVEAVARVLLHHTDALVRRGLLQGRSPAPTRETREVQKSISTIELAPSSGA